MKKLSILSFVGVLALAYFPASVTATPISAQAVSKGTVQAGIGVIGAVGSFFSFGAWNVSAAVHIFAIQVSNDITVATHVADSNFSSPVVAASLELDRSQTDVSGIPESVNSTFNDAVNAQLMHSSYLMAAATGMNRYFTALDSGDMTSAVERLADIANFVNLIDSAEDQTAVLFDSVANALQTTGTDFLIGEALFTDFQTDLGNNGFPASEIALFNALIPNMDQLLINGSPHIIDPIGFGLQQLSSVQFSDIAGNPPHYSDAVLQGSDSIRQISQVVGPFPVPEPTSISLILLGLFGLGVRKLRMLAPSILG